MTGAYAEPCFRSDIRDGRQMAEINRRGERSGKPTSQYRQEKLRPCRGEHAWVLEKDLLSK